MPNKKKKHKKGKSNQIIVMLAETDSNEVKFDQGELKVLASETRVEILKTLKDRNFTVSELSEKLGHSKSTLHEHISKLLESNLVEKADNYTNKWVYYRLSRRGKGLFVDNAKRVVVIISTILLITGVFQIAVFFTSVPLYSASQHRFVATDTFAEEATSPEAVSRAYPIAAPAAETEQKIGTKDEAGQAEEPADSAPSADAVGGAPAIRATPAPGMIEPETEEIPYYLVGGIGFISAAFILAHYYRGRPNKLFLEKKKKKR